MAMWTMNMENHKKCVDIDGLQCTNDETDRTELSVGHALSYYEERWQDAKEFTTLQFSC